MTKTRVYDDDVPEAKKQKFSQAWATEKEKTFGAAKSHLMRLEVDDTFDRNVRFTLQRGYYTIQSDIVSMADIAKGSPGESAAKLIVTMIGEAHSNRCVPLIALNVCDWDSDYADMVGANVSLGKKEKGMQ